MISTSSAPSRLHQLVQNGFPRSDPEDESEESEEESRSLRSNDGTDYEFEPHDSDNESDVNFSPTTEGRSKLEIMYSITDGRRSAIKEIKFYDARDTKSKNWKAILPFEKGKKGHRVAAAMSILCEDVTDTEGNLLRSDVASKICGLLLEDLDLEKALTSLSGIYPTYRKEDRTNGYLCSARAKLRGWYAEKATQMARVSNGKSRDILPSGQLKRVLETDRNGQENLPPAKRTPHSSEAVTPNPVVSATIQVQSSPRISYRPMSGGVQSAKGPGRQSFPDTQTSASNPSIPSLDTDPIHAPGKAIGIKPSRLRLTCERK